MTETILTSFETLTPDDIVTVRLTSQWMFGGLGAVDGQYRFEGVDSIGEAIFTAPAGSPRRSIIAHLNPTTGRYTDFANEEDVSVVVSDDGTIDEPARPKRVHVTQLERIAIGSEVTVRLTPRSRETETVDRRSLFTELDRNKTAFFTVLDPVGEDEEQTIIAMHGGRGGYSTDFGATMVDVYIPHGDLLPAPPRQLPFTVEVTTTVTMSVEITAGDRDVASRVAESFVQDRVSSIRGSAEVRVISTMTSNPSTQ